jgi:hypothetical protein
VYTPRLALYTFESIPLSDRLDVVRALIEALALADGAWLRDHPGMPLLYASGVVYRQDPFGSETWGDIPAILSATPPSGDCKDLVAWRLAELRLAGETGARPFLRRFTDTVQGRPILEYHVQLLRGDGRTIEDPSAVLGMR